MRERPGGRPALLPLGQHRWAIKRHAIRNDYGLRRAPPGSSRLSQLLLAGFLIIALVTACGSTQTSTTAAANNANAWKTEAIPSGVDALNGASCPTDSDCWVVGANSTGGGTVLATTKAGSSWRIQALPTDVNGPAASPMVVHLDGVSCPIESDCWAVGATSSNAAAVVATTDGGRIWNAQNLPGDVTALDGVSCPTPTDCWAVGTTSLSKGIIVATVNGGSTWNSQSLPTGIRTLNEVSCPTPSHCWAVGATSSNVGAVVATTDGGGTWSSQGLPSDIGQTLPSGLYALNGVSCATSSDCWAVGASSSNAGIVVATTNGGSTWSSQSLPSNVSLLDGASCPTSGHCWAVGATSSHAGVVVATTNGGGTWDSQRLPSGISILKGISCPTGSGCRAVGATTSNAGVILARSNH